MRPMKKLLQLTLVLMIFNLWNVNAQTPVLYWRFANNIVIPGSPNIAQFDVEITCSVPGTYHSDLQMYFDYNTTAFGTSIAANGKITYQRLPMLQGTLSGSPLYAVFGNTDNTDHTYTLFSEASFPIPNPATMNEVPSGGVWAGWAQFQIQIANTGVNAGIDFHTSLMDNMEYYLDATHSTPTKYGNPNIYANNLLNWSLTPPDLTKLIMTEIVDPGGTPANAKYVELYNGENFPVNCSYFQVYLARQANGTTWNDVTLTATIPPGGLYVIGMTVTDFTTGYGMAADQYSSYISGNGDDGYFLYKNGNHSTGTLLDAYGVINQQALSTDPWYYMDSHAVRKRNITTANSTWTESEWVIVPATHNQMTPKEHRMTKTWTGSVSSDWNAKGANWTGSAYNYVPDASDNVILPNGTQRAILNQHSACNDLTINYVSAITVVAPKFFTVAGTLTNNSGVQGLILKSGSTGTASLIHSTSGVYAESERYFSGSDWHYVSSPMLDSYSSVFLNYYLKSFDETTGIWSFIAPTNIPLNVMQGYSVWSGSGNATVKFKGHLNVGNLSIPVTYHSGASHNFKGFNLVGNPYPSAIDWNRAGWTKTNVDDAIYIWNPTNDQYGSYIAGVGTNGVTNIIPQNQGFIVHCNAATGTLGVSDNVKKHSATSFLKSSGTSEENILRLTINGNTYTDETVIRFDDETETEFEGNMDAYKLYGINAAPQLFSILESGDELSINTMPFAGESTVIDLGVKTGITGTYSINAVDIMTFMPGVSVFIEDVKKGSFTNLRERPGYTFESDPLDQTNRFKLHFTNPLPDPENNTDAIGIYARNQQVIIENYMNMNGKVVITDLPGQVLFSGELENGTTSVTVEGGSVLLVTITTPEYSTVKKVYIR